MTDGVLTREQFLETIRLLAEQRPRLLGVGPWNMHPTTARYVDWHLNRPLLRRLYREAGYPRGRNQGAFKRWALAVGRYGRTGSG